METEETQSTVRGRTEPRLHSPFYSDLPTRYKELVELADRLGEPLMPWQELVAQESMRVKDDGRWAFPQVGILVARQNGKSHFMRLRIIWGLVNGEKLQILSAHKLAVSLEHFNQVLDTIEQHDWLASQMKKIRRTNGQEEIQFLNGSRFKVVANNAAGRGYAGAETIYLDELREHKDYSAWSAITKTQLAAKNPQLYGFSNAGDATSIVLNELRDRGLATIQGVKDSLLWLEWSAPQNSDISLQTATWANPAMGRTIHPDNIEATFNEPEPVVRTEILCQWVDTLQSPWSPNAWNQCADPNLEVKPDSNNQTFLAFDITPRRNQCSLVAAQVIDGKIALGLVQTFDSDNALDDLVIANAVAEWARAYDVTEIAYSKNTGQAIATRLTSAGFNTLPIDGRKFAMACDQMLMAMEHSRLIHKDEVTFNKQIASCARIPFTEGGWLIGRRASHANVTGAVAAAMAISLASKPVSDTDIQYV
jgi:phage terminase large subunit-like protein